MPSNPRRSNGYRRDQVRARVLREEDACWICHQPVDKSLGKIPGRHGAKCVNLSCPGCAWHPKSPVIDEVIPVSLGGDPLDRNNCRLPRRDCNIRRGNGRRTAAKPPVEVYMTDRKWW